MKRSSLSLSLSLSLSVACFALLSGCSPDAAVAPTSIEPDPAAQYSQAAGDSVAWAGNVLEYFDDDGTPIKIVRDHHEHPTRLWMYRAGMLDGTADLIWHGLEVSEVRWTDASSLEWMQTTHTDDPVIVDESARPCPPEGCILPESSEAECEEGGFDSVASGCNIYRNFALGRAGLAIGCGIVGLATKGAAATVAVRCVSSAFQQAVLGYTAYALCLQE